jgi:tetratricopeptide (TPR) repeat protein
VAECEPPGLLHARIYIDLVGLSGEEARQSLLDGVREGRTKPVSAPPLPASGKTAPVFPGTIHNLPFPPNPLFTGRDRELENLGAQFKRKREVAITQTVVLHGFGGVGKTQLAVEYGWKHLRDYDAAFWVKADSPEAFDASLAGLASVLGLPEVDERDQAIQINAVLRWLHGHERWLLIANNADTELAAMAVRDRFPPKLRGAVLITSRLSDWPVNMSHFQLDFLTPADATRFLLDRVTKEAHNAGEEAAAQSLAQELGYLPLALEQAAAFIIEMHWSFDKYCERFRDARPELLSEHREGATCYPASVAKTWSITLDRLSPLARAILRIAAWFAPDAIPRDVFSADHSAFSEALGVNVSDFAIDKALGELHRFSLVRLTVETVSVHRLLQAVEQDSLGEDERERWLVWACRLFKAFAPASPDDVRTWGVWLPLSPHAESLLGHAEHRGELPLIAQLANLLGMFLHARAVYSRAEVLYRRAVAIGEKSFGPDHPHVAAYLNNLARILHATNRLQEAEALYRRAVEINSKSYGSDHPEVASGFDNLAQLLNDANRLEEAEPLMRRTLEIDKENYGLDHPDIARDLNNLARLLQDTDRLEEAEPLYRRALEIVEKSYGPDHPKVGRVLSNLAGLLQKTSRVEEVELLYRRALEIAERSYGSDHPDVAAALNNLARLLRATNRLEEAERLSGRNVVILLKFTRLTGHLHPHLRTALVNHRGLLRKMAVNDDEIARNTRALGTIAGYGDEAYRKLLEDVFEPTGIIENSLESPNAEPLIFTPSGARNFSLRLSRAPQGAPMTTGATALSPQDEPVVIKDFVRNSKGIKKHWVNYTPDGYVLTLLLPFSISQVDAATVGAYEIQAHEVRSILESQKLPVQMIIFRSSDGVLFAAG